MPLKKYFYTLRPLLSVRWIERYEKPAPIEFGKLLHLIEDQPKLIQEINVLLNKKRIALEMGFAEPVKIINDFIETELVRLENMNPQRTYRETPIPYLNELFHSVINEE